MRIKDRQTRAIKLEPIQLAPDAWYYEFATYIEVYTRHGLVAIISRRKLEASLKRMNKELDR